MPKDKEEKIDEVVEKAPVQAEGASDAVESEEESKNQKAKKKRKFKKHIPLGNAYVKATFNNTLVTITDTMGNVIASGSAGTIGYSGAKKSTPYVGGLVSGSVATKAKNFGLTDVNVFVKGIGSGREAAVRALQASGINVLAIKDVTPMPHAGCRRKKVRRV